MRRPLLATLLALTAAALTACSEPADHAQPSDHTPVSATSIRPTTAAPRQANAATIDACRSLATDEGLAEFWHEVNNSPTVPGWMATRATLAVMRLGPYATDPDVTPSVSAAMRTAITQTGDMNQRRAQGEPFDIDAFRSIVTPIVEACQEAGVDMAVPE